MSSVAITSTRLKVGGRSDSSAVGTMSAAEASQGATSNSDMYVVQNDELVPLDSADLISNVPLADHEKSRSLVRVLKTSNGINNIEQSVSVTVEGTDAGPGTSTGGGRAAIFTPIKVKTLPVKGEKGNPDHKESGGWDFAVFDNAENRQTEAKKRHFSPYDDGSQCPKRKRVKIVTPEKTVNNINTSQSQGSLKNDTKSANNRNSDDMGSRICRIKVEPEHDDISFPNPSNDDGLITLIPINRACKAEPLEEDWEGLDGNEFEQLLNDKNVVITVEDQNVGEIVMAEGNQKPVCQVIDHKKPLLQQKRRYQKRSLQEAVEQQQLLQKGDDQFVKSENTKDSSLKPGIMKCMDPAKRIFFQCDKCGYTSRYKNSVKRHTEHCGRDNSCTKRSCIFPNCQVKFYHVSQMIKHMEAMHSASIGVKNLSFSSMDEFHVWKEKEEIANFTYFTKHRGDSLTKSGLYSIYICQNDGSNKSHRKKGEPPRLTSRRYKKGTIKTGATCPSRMFVTVHCGEVTVKYFFSHNHELKFENTQYHPIARKSLDYIKGRFSVGASPKQVQDELRNKAVFREKKEGNEEYVKGQLISLRTLNAIKHGFLSSFRLDKDDANSVFLLVKEWEKEEFNPIMLYKPQYCPIVIGNCNKHFPSQSDVFFIALQTKAQFEILNSRTSRLLCIDTTYFNGRHGFYLLSLIVHDENGTALPVAHFISNCKNEEVLRYFFSTVRERCPKLTVHGVMTDTEYRGCEAFLGEFGYVSSAVCQWHLKKNWKKKAEVLVESEMLLEVMSDLSTMLEERKEQNLSNLIVSFSLKYGSAIPKFVEYFQSNVASQTEIWAMCFRDLSVCNSVTNMYCKTFHDTLEVFFTKTKSKKRIDDLLLLLLRMEETDIGQKLGQMEPVNWMCEPKLPISNHSKSLDIADTDVTELDGKWKVVCQEDKSQLHEVSKLAEECQQDVCIAECQDLPCGNLCSHLYECSCGDNSGLCAHIHKVHSGKGNVTIICSLDDRAFVAPQGKKELILHIGPLEPELTPKDEKLALLSAIDHLDVLGTYLHQPVIQQELLPHIAKTLEQLVSKCRELSEGQNVP